MKRRGVILALLLATLAVGVVYGAVLIYDWSLSLTGAEPAVRFIKWSDSSTYNTLDLPYNIYKDMWVYESNATHGIKNTNATVDKTVDIYINTISDTTKVANVTLQILSLDGTAVEATCTWPGEALGTKKSFTAAKGTSYIIRVWLKGSGTVVKGDSVTVGMKLEVAE